MRTTDGITLHQAVVHLVDPQKPAIKLSAGTLSLDSPPELRQYLTDHIHKSLRDPAARSARFRRSTTSPSKLYPIITSVIDGSIDFIDGTTSVATHLLAASDKRISPGALILCLYSATSHPTVDRFFAVLKLDPSAGFRPVESTDGNGVFTIRFELIEDVVPSAGERLLKCAFTQPCDIDSEDDLSDKYDLMVLDRQKSGSNEPAQFFTDSFLGAILTTDPQILTRRFYHAAVDTVTLLRNELGPRVSDRIRNAIDVAVSGLRINVDDWVDNLPIEAMPKNAFRRKMAQSFADVEFEVDPSEGDRLRKQKVFKGDYGFKLQIPADKFSDILVKRTSGDGYEEITLHVRGFHEVTK